jgi:hypothetical protein
MRRILHPAANNRRIHLTLAEPVFVFSAANNVLSPGAGTRMGQEQGATARSAPPQSFAGTISAGQLTRRSGTTFCAQLRISSFHSPYGLLRATANNGRWCSLLTTLISIASPPSPAAIDWSRVEDVDIMPSGILRHSKSGQQPHPCSGAFGSVGWLDASAKIERCQSIMLDSGVARLATKSTAH